MMKSSKTKRGIFFGLLCAAMVFAPLAAAGQDITINANIADTVYGNGDLPDGSWGGGLKDLNGNTVTQSGGEVTGYVYGGYLDDTTNLPGVSGNSVTIDGGQVNGKVYGGSISFTSGATDASAEGNHVTLNSGGVGVDIYGGCSETDATGQARAAGNTVTINGGTAGGYIYGGQSFSYGNSAYSLNNSVTVLGGTINGNAIYGGYAISSGTGMSAAASDNSVDLSGGDITDYLGVYGGYGGYGGVFGSEGTGAATGNSVTVGGSFTLSGAGPLVVFGGDSNLGIGADTFTGNTFNKNSDVLVSGASSFENVNFGYSGDANIKTLSTNPGGSAKDTVNIDTGSYSVVFNGTIEGSGNIDKKGSGELTLTHITWLAGTITLSEGTLKNGTGSAITVAVNGVPQQLAPGESATNNAGGGDVTNEGGGSGGGCDAGAGVFALALLPIAYAGMKRREK